MAKDYLNRKEREQEVNNRIKFGEEKDFKYSIHNEGECAHCGVLIGEYHGSDCPFERFTEKIVIEDNRKGRGQND